MPQLQTNQDSSLAAGRMKMLLVIAVAISGFSWLLILVAFCFGSHPVASQFTGMAATICVFFGCFVSTIISLDVIVAAVMRSRKDMRFEATGWCLAATGAILFAAGTYGGLAALTISR